MSADASAVLKPFTIISGEPKKIDCYLKDLSLRLYWCKSKQDVIEHLLRVQDPKLRCIPLDRDSGYTSVPSPYHLVNCNNDSCPCSKYVMCWECEGTKEALPEGGVVIKTDGCTEELKDEEQEDPFKCDKPNFLSKAEFCLEAIDGYCDSDYCFKLVELRIEEVNSGTQTCDDAKPKPQKVAKVDTNTRAVP